MSLQLGAMEGVRENLLRKTAENRSKQLSSGNSYEETITSVLDKISKGQSAGTSSGADLLRKITNEENSSSNVAQLLAGSSDYTKKAALADQVKSFVQDMQVLAKQGEGSLFIKSKAVTLEAQEAFDFSCTADGPSFSLEVKQLAQSQKNVGCDVELAADSGFLVGRKYFDFTIDGKTTSLVIKVSEGDTAKDVMTKLVSAVNRADCGVTAQLVSSQTEPGKGHIEITCNGTGAPIKGEDKVFYFTNQSQEDVVAQFGLNEMQQEGKDAIFNFNHAQEDTTYMYNSALIDGTVSVEFKKVTDGPVEVSFDYDYDSLSQALENYVTAYNNLKKAVQKSDYKTVENYFSQIVKETKSSKETLAGLGITVEAGGTLQYNSGFLYQTDMAELKSLLNDSETGYASRIQGKAENLSKYMDRLTGKTKKYYGLRAKKSNAHLRQLLNS